MRRALVVGAATLAVLVAGSAHAGLVPPLHSAALSFPVNSAFSAARITADLGHITVTAGQKAAVQAHEEWNLRQPTVHVAVSRGVLTVTASCDATETVGPASVDPGNTVNECVDDISVTLPGVVSVNADSGSSGVTVVKTHGDLQLHSGNGDINMRDVFAPHLSAATDVGNIVGTRIHVGHAATLTTGTGSITASAYAYLPHASWVRLDASTDSGDITLDGLYTVEATASTGKGNISVSDMDVRGMSVRAGTGDMRFADGEIAHLVAHTDQGNLINNRAAITTATWATGSGSISLDGGSYFNVTATSGNGDVTVISRYGKYSGLPRYAVQADTDNGTVTVRGIKVDPDWIFHIRAHSDDGNVSVLGEPCPPGTCG
ncbi:MAG TPA: DUF4097 family beta strand repeat-containing protein [Mycobacteriales bacterium]|nr:DUF4097 family beta strand repeat-containing protein [Mycobacteriales bacterium]